jgi:hypothetical protein
MQGWRAILPSVRCPALQYFDIYMSKGYYIIVWRCAPHRQIVTSELVRLLSRWPRNTLCNYMCGVACCRKEWGEAPHDEAHGARIVWGGLGKQWTEKESFQQYFYNRYKILHTCHTYGCYAYHFYAYWLYFIYVWHVYVSPKTYKWFGTFIIKDGRYTFSFFHLVSHTAWFSRKKVIDYKMCFDFLDNFCLQHVSFQERSDIW